MENTPEFESTEEMLRFMDHLTQDILKVGVILGRADMLIQQVGERHGDFYCDCGWKDNFKYNICPKCGIVLYPF